MDIRYANDSFHTLAGTEQVGLALLSLALAAAVIAVGWHLAGRLIGLLRAILLFWSFVWLSPQIYYLYYQWIFDDLPWQIIVGAPPPAIHILQFLMFQGPVSLSDHGTGVLGWSLIGVALWRWYRHGRKRSKQEPAP